MDFSKEGNRSLIGFDESPFYTGSQYISPIYEYILTQSALKLTYQPFTKEAIALIISPYYLKQYNQRWFLVGKAHGLAHPVSIYPLDRINHVEECRQEQFIPTDINFTEYFDDMIGVTKESESQKLEKVVLRVGKKRYKYIATKPIHSSQKALKERDDQGEILTDLPYQDIELQLFINKELEALILSFGKDVEVIEPISLRDRIVNHIQSLCKDYQLDCK